MKTNERGFTMNGKSMQNNMQTGFLEDQLYEAQQALFAATSIKQVKFLQSKIKYLRQKVKENGR